MSRFLPQERKAYLRKQKEEFGRHLFGIFPAQYPKEIFWALNALPVEIWDPPLDVSHASAHLQPTICSVVRLGLELILQGQCEMLDGFLFPHTCDSIQNLASIVNDYLDLKKPCFFFYHPKAPYRSSSRLFYMEQLRDLGSKLEKDLVPLDTGELRRRVTQGQEITSCLRELYDLRSKGKLRASNKDFYQVIRQGEYLHPDDFLPLLTEFLKTSKGDSSEGPSLVLSGVLPNPREILSTLDELEIRVVDDDFLSCGRRLLQPTSRAADPWEALVEMYFEMPPCTTKGSSLEKRIEHLLHKVRKSRARGVIFWTVKFCEPELFDLPPLIEAMKKEGIRTMVIESELNQSPSGQIRTRLEAFIEMMG